MTSAWSGSSRARKPPKRVRLSRAIGEPAPATIAQPRGGIRRLRGPLSANMGEPVTPWKFRVEGEAGLERNERTGAGSGWAGDRGRGAGVGRAVPLGGIIADQAARPALARANVLA